MILTLFASVLATFMKEWAFDGRCSAISEMLPLWHLVVAAGETADASIFAPAMFLVLLSLGFINTEK